ncbi:T9SS type A sorting domain-containing protein [Nonlabens ulvanivorans]|uniref:Secreted protein (Por secretion system target) n=2 Tax=Nonlabens ulvanivorans TaxID=906888 RepID=A0ABX5E7X1_NONUL|nr:T9SS type A sorting domain-containing protein [Nonlabens ulvanivorans]PRX14445.1 putative secreted protein (Por secretion system target) [Nonlabens ulvanivorans]
MKYILVLIVFFISLLMNAQAELDFDMDVTNGPIGGYADVTYTITNLSPNDTYSNVTINHPDALIPNIVLNPSTIGPGIQVTATGQIPLSGDSYSVGLLITQATATGIMNGSMITELSDGIDSIGNRIDDGQSVYFRHESSSYGVIYLDTNGNSMYDDGIDTTIPGAVINLYDDQGNTDSLVTNETGWWYFDNSFINTTLPDYYAAIIDVNSFPSPTNSYHLVDGPASPFTPNGWFASNIRMSHGYVDDNFGTIEASSFLDTNGNGSRDNGEVNIPYTSFEFIKDNNPATSEVIFNGFGNTIRRTDLNPGVQLNDINAALTAQQAFYSITTTNYDDIQTVANQITSTAFAVTEVSSSNRDTSLTLTPMIWPNPGFDSTLEVTINNLHAGNSTGTLQFNHDPMASIIAVYDRNGIDILANGTATVTSSGFSTPYNIMAFGQYDLEVVMATPVTGVQLGDIFTHNASINPTSTDSDATNNNTSVDVTVVASYDPNDVTEARGPGIPIDTFSTNDFLEYTIRFQNLGTASAQFVRVLSSLHPSLDESTFEVIVTSHAYLYTKNGRQLDFLFENIHLPPEVVDEPGSNGFITYRIKPLAGYAAGDTINASAEIFFDYNPAVITETWITTFNAPASLNDQEGTISIYPNPLKGNELYTNLEEGTYEIYELKGSKVVNGTIENGIIQAEIANGFYILKITSSDEVYNFKVLKE